MLQLLGLLQTHRYWPGPDLAARLDVSERTLRRDVDRLRALGYDVDAVRWDASVRFLTKVVGMLPPALRRSMDALAAVAAPAFQYRPPAIDAEILTRLTACCRDAEYAGFDYVAGDGTATERRVEAHELVSYGQRWYLVGWDTRRQDWRTFRLDRITNVMVAGDRFRRRDIPGGIGPRTCAPGQVEHPAAVCCGGAFCRSGRCRAGRGRQLG